MNLKNSKLASFGMTAKNFRNVGDDQGLQSLILANTPVITIVGKTWDFHVKDVLGVTNEENLKMIQNTISYLVKKR